MFINTNIKAQQLPPQNPNYQLVFSDEFDSTGLDASKWRSGYPWGNVEYWHISGNDTAYTRCYTVDSLFSFGTNGSGFIRMPVKYYNNPPIHGHVYNYNRIDTNFVHTTTLIHMPYNHSNMNVSHCRADTILNYTYNVDLISQICIDSIVVNQYLTVDSVYISRHFYAPVKDFNYATSFLFSKNTFRYGYFEIRTHMPYLDQNHNNQGVGPTFWLWNANNAIPHSEVDIYEILDKSPEASYNISDFPLIGHYKHNLTNTIHFKNASMQNLNSEHAEFGHLMFNDDTCHKTLSALWDKQSLQFYRNDTLIRSTNFHTDSLIDMHIIIGNSCPVTWAFDNTGHHFYIMPDLDSTKLPYNYDVDYVRVYQLKLHCDSDYNTSVFNPDTFGYGLYRTITIGGGTSVISSGKDVDLIATDGITINGDFTVAAGASLLLETKPCQQEQNLPKSEPVLTTPPSFYHHYLHE
ncbi:MAG: hypothetical protein Fur0028_11460 [Bacteroidales bacterium]